MTLVTHSDKTRDFGTGSVRECSQGKGRYDLLPLLHVAQFLGPEPDQVFCATEVFLRTGDTRQLKEAINYLIETEYGTAYDMIPELAKHYEAGALKYADRNWEHGQPLHVYIDSALRHYIKHLKGDEDEPHLPATLWNLFGAWWTKDNLPDMNDLPIILSTGIPYPCEESNPCDECKYSELSTFDEPCVSCINDNGPDDNFTPKTEETANEDINRKE